MTDFASLFSSLLATGDFLSVVKLVFLVVVFLFGLFTFVVVRQISLMNKSFQTTVGPFFTLVGYLQFFAVVALFVLSLIIL